MLERLPYTLTAGVTATREGLVFDGVSDATHVMHPAMAVEPEWDTQYGEYFLSWPDAAERLRYRDGEPWTIGMDILDRKNAYQTVGSELLLGRGDPEWHHKYYLHRLAAILCDDAEAFLVLHWCVENLGGRG